MRKGDELDKSAIQDSVHKLDNPKRGLNNGKKFIPILKGGGAGFITKKTEHYISWTTDAVAHYKTDKKARFQNPSYYFQSGIGVPMVRTKILKAFLLENRLIDQSVVGIFPKEKRLLKYLVALLNSKVASDLLSQINHTTNNSANYLKRLPIIVDESKLSTVNDIVTEYVNDKIREDQARNKIDQIFEKIYQP